LEYDSNNSGGRWWLGDQDWKNLEDAGWTVHWLIVTQRDLSHVGGRSEYVTGDAGRRYIGDGEDRFALLERHQPGPRWPDSPRTDERILKVATSYDEAVALREQHGGYIGNALAVSCAKAGPDPHALVREFEQITGENAGDEGCNCCGKPHSFTWHDTNNETHYGGIKVTSEFCGFDV
jgi:hypothetical protein